MVAGGDAIGRLDDGRVVLCEGGLPGEQVTVALTERRRDFARGRVTAVAVPSPLRTEPWCPHVAEGCGGCTWQHVATAAQGRLKADIVADALRHIAHLSLAPAVGPGVPATGYRTSLRLAVTDDGRPAYRERHGHALVPVDSCPVAHPLLEELVVDGRFPGARSVLLRVGARTGDRLAVADRLSARPSVPAGTVTARSGRVTEEIAGRRWRISAGSFAQPGPDAWEVIVGAVLRAAAGAGGTIVDLYAGIGVLGGSVVAAGGGRLTSVESHPAAVSDATRNLRGLDARVIRGEVAEACRGARGRGVAGPGVAARGVAGRPDLVIADPPRTGLGPSAASGVVSLGAPVVVLVSCDPASLARDARLLGAAGYRLESVEVLDLFPGTFHLEAVSRFAASGEAATPA